MVGWLDCWQLNWIIKYIYKMNAKNTFENIDEYISSFPENVRLILTEIRHLIRELAPEAVETISYNMPAFKLGKKRDDIVVYFAGYKNHIGFYPMPATIAHFEEALTHFKYAKGSIQFPLKAEIPYHLIRKMIVFRLNDIKASKTVV